MNNSRNIVANNELDFTFIALISDNKKISKKAREKILKYLRENPFVTTEELAAKTGITSKGIEWQIKNLKKLGIVKRIGPAKGGYWEISEDE